nr:F-box only protein 21-like [Onthophagus taurus]
MLDKLPTKILQVVIEQRFLNLEDLINLSSTCSGLRSFILQNNVLWKKLYLEKWSEIVENSFKIEDYFSEFRHGYKIHRNVDEILINLATECIDKKQLSDTDFEDLIQIIDLRFLNREYIEHYLRQILNDHSEINTSEIISLKTPGNLTLKYYSLLTLHYLRHVHLQNYWTQFCSCKEKDQLLEIGATLLNQWLNPQCVIKIENVRNQFDEITEQVKNHLKTTKPNHPLFQTSEDELKSWRNKNISENKFTSSDCCEILEAMKHVIFEINDFCTNESNVIENQFISDVFESKRGGEISLAIIYEGVARRMGVHLDIVYTKNQNILLKLTKHDMNEEVCFVNVFEDVYKVGRIYSDPIIRIHAILSPKLVIKKMIEDISFILTNRLQPLGQRVILIRSILELNHVLNPDDFRVIRSLARYYIKHDINTTPLQQLLRIKYYYNPKDSIDILCLLARGRGRSSEERNKRVAPRFQAKFAVGMVMKHKKENYTCLIYQWKNIFIRYNTIYDVLLGDGTKRSVNEDDLMFSGVDTGLGNNPEIGRFFTHFFNHYYVPNSAQNNKFPRDSEIRISYPK